MIPIATRRDGENVIEVTTVTPRHSTLTEYHLRIRGPQGYLFRQNSYEIFRSEEAAFAEGERESRRPRDERGL